MGRADHLGEIDDNRFTRRPSNKDVEFVEITVDQPRVSEPNYEIHELRI